MKEKKRWGKKFRDDRDWRQYNEELVIRGEFLLDCEWVGSWNAELEEMNMGKVGAKYEFPESLIRLQAVWHQWVDYRGTEGITRKLVEAAQLPCFNDYSTINRRVNRLDVRFELPFKDCCVSSDSSGMKFENAGEYRARMYGKKQKKYIRVTISADPRRKKMLDCEVSIEGEGGSDSEIAIEHMENLLSQNIRVKKFWGDGSFDSFDLFAFLEHNNIEPAVKPRKSAIVSGDGTLRDKEVLKIKKGYKQWARERQYGLRWNGTEGIFSAVKRKFGEQTRSHKIENACSEVRRKFWAYDTMKVYADGQA